LMSLQASFGVAFWLSFLLHAVAAEITCPSAPVPAAPPNPHA